jgi:hypothetical protein
MSGSGIRCPLCDLSSPLVTMSPDPDRHKVAVWCRRCGSFSIASDIPDNWDIGRVPRFLDDSSNNQFDTRQYNHILWETPAELRGRLRDRILATMTAVSV